VGDPTRVRLAEFDGPVHQGQVTRISAKGNERTGAFEVEIEVSAPEGLRSGMVAEVEITATTDRTADAALLVPTLSLLDARADQGVVFVVEAESIAHRRAVRTAGVTQEGVIVVEGLAADERVIGVGAAYVRDGDKVRIAAEN
jgi:multidrug efflux pump subunit AcrA (membrane-fusion protein)